LGLVLRVWSVRCAGFSVKGLGCEVLRVE